MTNNQTPEHIRYTQAMDTSVLADEALELLRQKTEENTKLRADFERLGHEVTRLNVEIGRRTRELTAQAHEQAINYSLALQREAEERQAGARARALARALAQNTARTATAIRQIQSILQAGGVDSPSLAQLFDGLVQAQNIALSWVARDLPADDDDAERN